MIVKSGRSSQFTEKLLLNQRKPYNKKWLLCKSAHERSRINIIKAVFVAELLKLGKVIKIKLFWRKERKGWPLCSRIICFYGSYKYYTV